MNVVEMLEEVRRETGTMTTAVVEDYFFRRSIFDPPLPGSLIAGVPVCRVPDSRVKYGSFLEWWFAVGRKAPVPLTGEGWAKVRGPHACEGKREAIPAEEWEALPETEREAIREWARRIPMGVWFSR
jgi:hypothetical protein